MGKTDEKPRQRFDLSDIKKPSKQGLFEDKTEKIKSPKKTNKKVGRPRKPEQEKLSESIMVNLTKEEKENLNKLSSENYYNMPIGKVIRIELQNAGLI